MGGISSGGGIRDMVGSRIMSPSFDTSSSLGSLFEQSFVSGRKARKFSESLLDENRKNRLENMMGGDSIINRAMAAYPKFEDYMRSAGFGYVLSK